MKKYFSFFPFFLFFLLFMSGGRLSAAAASEAKHYLKLPDGGVRCLLCPRECTIADGQSGTCTARRNEKGKLVSLVYAQVCAVSADPVEKKPLFHFLPATKTFSLATAGCNLRCIFCQNWNLSQSRPSEVDAVSLLPGQAVALAREKSCPSLSYTYSEPTVFYEYMYDTAFLARQHGLKNAMITCGYINPGPLRELCSVLDAANVDLKGFSEKTYRLMSSGKLAPVLGSLKIMKEKGVWLEVGYLVIPTVNDSPEELRDLVQWTAKNLGPDVPLHFLRFFPQHKLTNLPPTSVETLEQAYTLAKEAGLNYVYIGNVPGHRANHTYCPACKKLLLERKGFFLAQNNIVDGKCRYCGKKIAGVWK